MDADPQFSKSDIKKLLAKLYAIEKELAEITAALKENQNSIDRLQKYLAQGKSIKHLEEPQTVTAGSTVIVRM